MVTDHAIGKVLNIGSGRSFTVREVAEKIALATGHARLAPEITGKYRMGDVRHCFADIGRARDLLGYEPEVPFEVGMSELATWLRGQVAHDRVKEAKAELDARGLTL